MPDPLRPDSYERWKLALHAFIGQLRQLYGENLVEVRLYGSRARGDAEEDSDIDVLVVLRECKDFWEELRRIDPIAGAISLEYDVLISTIPALEEAYLSERSSFFMNVRKESVVV